MLQGQLRCQNDRNAILYDTSFSSMVERVLFHPLSSRFLKENHFWGGSCDETHVTIGPKGALGSQKNLEEVTEVSEEIWRFLKTFCEPTLSNLLRPAPLFSYSSSYAPTCVKALAFQAPNKGPFEAQYKRQSFLFEIWLNKLLLGKKLPTLQN